MDAEQLKGLRKELHRKARETYRMTIATAEMYHSIHSIMPNRLIPAEILREVGDLGVLDEIIEESAGIIKLARSFYNKMKDETEAQKTFPFLIDFVKYFGKEVNRYEQVHKSLCEHEAGLRPWGEKN